MNDDSRVEGYLRDTGELELANLEFHLAMEAGEQPWWHLGKRFRLLREAKNLREGRHRRVS